MTAGSRVVSSEARPASGPVAVSRSPHASLRPLRLGEVQITGGLWGDRQRLNREVLLPGAARHLEAAGNFDNLRAAAGHGSAPFRGPVFMDSDVYKWLEALGWELGRDDGEGLVRLADDAISLVAEAQDRDGYLNSYYQVAQPAARWSNLAHDHELYCAGHLIQAAVAHARGRGDERLLHVARRFADHIERVFIGSDRPGTPGHPEIEMALVELFRESEERHYLELAEYFVDQRGHRLLGPGHFGASYFQDEIPVREATTVRGHAVRALYLAAGVTDIYLETGETDLLAAIEAQWRDMTAAKLYLTGGLGAHHQDEAFGDPFELPPDRCYGETCAAIASVMWNWRMLLATGKARYADLLERTLYNGFLAGVALDGSGFSYVNPLQVREQHHDPVERGARRQAWYEVACCPPNVMRLLASLQHYLISTDGEGVQVHQYAPARVACGVADGRRVAFEMLTEYPWQGSVTLQIEEAPSERWTLSLRIPEWAGDASVVVNGEPVQVDPGAGYTRVARVWRAGDLVELDLPMPARLTEPHPRIDAVRGCVAIERGPLVYCTEKIDQPAQVGIDDLGIDPSAPLRADRVQQPLHGAIAVKAEGVQAPAGSWPRSGPYGDYRPAGAASELERVELTAIPYALWGNRGDGAMRVWIPIRS